MTLAYMQIDHIAFIAIAMASVIFWLVTRVLETPAKPKPTSITDVQGYPPTISSLPESITPNRYNVPDVMVKNQVTNDDGDMTCTGVDEENSNKRNSLLIDHTKNSIYLKAPLVIQNTSQPRDALKPAEPLQPKSPIPAISALTTVKQRKR